MLNSNNPYNQFDPREVVSHLKKLHPNLPALDRIKFSKHISGYEWLFGKSRYIPRAFKYKYNEFGRNLNINEFMGVKLSEIAQLPEPERIAGINDFASNYVQNYIMDKENAGSDYRLMRQMPRAREGRASYFKHAGLVQDLDALGAKTDIQGWAQSQLAAGQMIDPQKINQYMTQQNLPSELMFGMQGVEDIRKYTTLENANIVGRAKGINSPATLGGSTPLSITPKMIEVAQLQSEAHLFKSGPDHIMARAEELANSFMNTGNMYMTQFSNAGRLRGDPILFKRGLFKNQYTFPEKEIFLDPSELRAMHSAMGTDIAGMSGGSNLKGSSVIANLIESGIAPSRARRMMEAVQAGTRGDIFAIQKSAAGARLMYGRRQAIGAGSKFTVGGAKALGGEVQALDAYGKPIAGGWRDILSESRGYETGMDPLWTQAVEEAGGDFSKAQNIFRKARKADIIATPLGDEARALKRQFEGIQGFLTHPRFNPNPESATANAAALGNILGVEASGRHLLGQTRLTPAHIEQAKGLLSPMQRTQFETGLMPAWTNILDERKRIRRGKLATVTINDIAGAKIQGLHKLGQLYATQIAMNPHSNQVSDVFGYLSGRYSNINAMDVGRADIDDLLGRTVFNKGRIENYRGSLLFDPAQEMGPYMLNLGESVNLNVGGRTVTTDKFPLLSPGARGIKEAAGGNVYQTFVDKHYKDLLQAVKSGKGVEAAAQNAVGAMGKFGGKAGLVDRMVTRTKVEGIYGAGTFFSPEAEKQLAAKYGESGGFIGLTMEQFRGIYSGKTDEEIRGMIEQGIHLPYKREPAAPRGVGVGRAVEINDELMRHANFGKDVIPVSAGLGAYAHQDIDNDFITIQTEWAKSAQENAEVRATMEESYKKGLERYSGFEENVIKKLSEKKLKAQPELSEVINAALYKENITGPAYVTGMQTYEGALELGHSQEMASDLSQVMFGIAETGINAKRGVSSKEIPNVYDILRRGDTEQLGSIASDVIDELHGAKYSGASRPGFINKLMSAAQWGSEAGSFEKTAPYTVNRSLYRANTVAGIDRAIHVEKPAPGTVISEMVKSRVIRQGGAVDMATKSIGVTNKALSNMGREGMTGSGHTRESIGRMTKEAVGDYVSGLRQGRGWTSIAVGATILAGVGLGFKKPGNIIVQNQESMNEGKPPVVQSRKQQTSRVMTEGQYNAIIKMKNVRKVDRSKFVDLSQAISGKYRSPSKVQINLKDDTNDIDYEKVFNDAYRKSMQQGRS